LAEIRAFVAATRSATNSLTDASLRWRARRGGGPSALYRSTARRTVFQVVPHIAAAPLWVPTS
jgi:hypothetical protein